MKKILTLDQLAAFCASNNLMRFSSAETGYKICVQVPSHFEKKDYESDQLLYGTVKLLHTNTNRNKSNITKEAAEKCLATIKYKPILANFCEVDGEQDFTSHDVEFTDDGVEYIERQVGCFTSDEPYMEYDEDKDRYYIYATAAIPKEYTKAAEIIERKGGTKVSAEIYVNEMSYDIDNKELVLSDIEVMGATLLGKNPDTGEDVQEGMEGARLDIADFSVSNDSAKFASNTKIIEALDNESEFNIKVNEAENTLEKGGDDMFQKLLEQYGKTVEDLDFEYEGLTDEELELAFKEAFEENSEEEKVIDDTENINMTEEEPEKEEFVAEYSMTIGDSTRKFSVSLSDKIYALQTLVNDTYSESDNDYYYVDVYEEEKYVVMHGWDHSYRQTYKVKSGNYSLVGDRVEVFAQFLTADEIKKLDEMRQNYSEISQKLEKYEAEPEKMEILRSDEYSFVANTEEFVELMDETKHFDMSVEDVRKEADSILLKYAKAHSFSSDVKNEEEDNKSINKKQFVSTSKKKASRYGSLFSK